MITVPDFPVLSLYVAPIELFLIRITASGAIAGMMDLMVNLLVRNSNGPANCSLNGCSTIKALLFNETSTVDSRGFCQVTWVQRKCPMYAECISSY